MDINREHCKNRGESRTTLITERESILPKTFFFGIFGSKSKQIEKEKCFCNMISQKWFYSSPWKNAPPTLNPYANYAHPLSVHFVTRSEILIQFVIWSHIFCQMTTRAFLATDTQCERGWYVLAHGSKMGGIKGLNHR